MFTVYVKSLVDVVECKKARRAKSFGDLETTTDYIYNIKDRWHIIDLVHEDTGQVLATVQDGYIIYDKLNEFLNPPAKPIPDVCNCDFSRGNFSCTCGAGRREIEASKLAQFTNPCGEIPLGSNPSEDDVPF